MIRRSSESLSQKKSFGSFVYHFPTPIAAMNYQTTKVFESYTGSDNTAALRGAPEWFRQDIVDRLSALARVDVQAPDIMRVGCEKEAKHWLMIRASRSVRSIPFSSASYVSDCAELPGSGPFGDRGGPRHGNPVAFHSGARCGGRPHRRDRPVAGEERGGTQVGGGGTSRARGVG
jgi:hypothetical protein